METSQRRDTRWSVRKPVNLVLDLFIRDQSFSNCISTDLSLGGIYVEFQSMAVRQNEIVDVLIWLDPERKEMSHRFRTKVAHSSDSGMGLAFKDFTIKDFRMLQQVLKLEKEPEPINTTLTEY